MGFMEDPFFFTHSAELCRDLQRLVFFTQGAGGRRSLCADQSIWVRSALIDHSKAMSGGICMCFLATSVT